MLQDFDYSFVRPELHAFLRAKLALKASGKVTLTSPFNIKGMAITDEPASQALLQELGMDIWEFAEKFINPWQGLTGSQVERTLAIWNEMYRDKKYLELEAKPIRIFEALQWTVAQVIDWLPEAGILPAAWDGTIPRPRTYDEIAEDEDLISILYLGTDYALPYKQCLYCGRLDRDLRGKSFRKNGKLCHAHNCDTSDPNPQKHLEDCCYGAWKRLKKRVDGQFERNQSRKHKLRSMFRAFCEMRYQENSKIKNAVRARHSKPENLKFAFESC